LGPHPLCLTIGRVITVLCLAAASIFVASCGGGGVQVSSELLSSRGAPTGSPFPSALAAAPFAALDDDALFDWAERQYGQFFPSHQTTHASAPYVFRFYPETQTYLAVTSGTLVQVLGPMFGPDIVTVGAKTDFACIVLPQLCMPAVGGNPANLLTRR
jgi:hypothetical protein